MQYNHQGQKGKIISGYRDLEDNLRLESIEAQLAIAAIGTVILKDRRICVLEVDMGDSPERNVKMITNALGGFT